PMEYPKVITNSDGAGIIDQVGPAVDRHRLGKRVWLYNGQRNGRWMGTAAEYIALSVDLVTELPDHVSFAEGATLGVPAMTAHRAVFVAGPVQGKTLLVTGGAGAVGHYAVQLATWAGARVIATVSSAEKAERARAGGAAPYPSGGGPLSAVRNRGGPQGCRAWRQGRYRHCGAAALSRPIIIEAGYLGLGAMGQPMAPRPKYPASMMIGRLSAAGYL